MLVLATNWGFATVSDGKGTGYTLSVTRPVGQRHERHPEHDGQFFESNDAANEYGVVNGLLKPFAMECARFHTLKENAI